MAITCKAAITDGNGNFKIEDILVQDPEPDEVLVQTKSREYTMAQVQDYLV